MNLPGLARVVENHDVATIDVHGASARGIPLLTNGHLGADMIYLEPGDSFPLHVHPGHYFLHCVKGQGTVRFDGKDYPIGPGDMYMIEAAVPHAVAATPDGPGHWLVAFGAPHSRIDATTRMQRVDEDSAS